MATSTLIGLDIGSMSIRAVETRRGKDEQSIVAFGQVPLPVGTVQGGVIQDDKIVTAALRHLWANTKFRGRTVVLGVTNPQVVVREMAVLNLPAKEMRSSLPFQVRDVLPLPVEKSLLDFYPLENPGSNENVRGLLIAAPKEPITIAIGAVERAGLYVARVDLASFALLRATSLLDSQVEAIVDIGAQSTSVIVHVDGTPLIVRTVPRGGAEITERIAERLNIDPAEAETLKCRVGLRRDNDPETATAVDDAVRPLINELRSSFTYLASGERQSRVTRVALSGGGSMLPGLTDAIAEQLDVQAVVANPVVRLRDVRRGRQDELSRFRSSAAVSIGLTLGAA